MIWCQSLLVDLGVSRKDMNVGAWLSLSGCESVRLSIASCRHRFVIAFEGESSTKLSW